MNLASLLKSDEKKYRLKSLTGKSAVWRAQKPKTCESILVNRSPLSVTPPPHINDREVKDLTQNYVCLDMIANALIVILIASVSYFFIPAKTVEPIMETAVTSNSEPSQSR